MNACETHQDLVNRAMGPTPSDADLARYADEVPDCAACQRRLTVELGVHPLHLAQGASEELEAIETRAAMDDAAIERLVREVEARPVWKWWLIGALAVAALFLVLLRPAPAPPTTPVHSTPIEPVRTGASKGPARQVGPGSPVPAPVEPVLIEDVQDAVALADDWPEPAYEELRSHTPKAGVQRDARLILDGTPTVGGTVRLAVIATGAAQLALCVNGEERGTLWRGGVPHGRTLLTRARQPVAYAFPRPGVYRFALSYGQHCGTSVHTVEVTL